MPGQVFFALIFLVFIFPALWLLIWSSRRNGRAKTVLVLMVRNVADIIEAIIWDVLKLQDERQGIFNLIVLETSSTDDTWAILQKMRQKHGFVLINSAECPGQKLSQLISGSDVKVVDIVEGDTVWAVRHRIRLTLGRWKKKREIEDKAEF